MIIKRNIILTGLGIILFSINALASDWVKIVNLKGYWDFSVGDDMAWSKPEFSSDDWDKINVPADWDLQYPNYNGYGWYRKYFDIHALPDNGELRLILGQIDDVDEVFVNGIKIGQTGKFMPDYQTAYNIGRNYVLDRSILKAKNNLITVRVYDEAHGGGIVSGDRIGIYFDNDYSLLEYDLSGDWKFSVIRYKDMDEAGFDDREMKDIRVPGHWENQGFEGHDGYAWYRKTFSMPGNRNDELYLVLGKIDDRDKVYLNGKLIGRVEYMDQYSRLNSSAAYRLYRVYKIPQDLLKSKNVLLVEVYDQRLGGGIYEGPIGIMTEINAMVVEERNKKSYWINPINIFFEIFD